MVGFIDVLQSDLPKSAAFLFLHECECVVPEITTLRKILFEDISNSPWKNDSLRNTSPRVSLRTQYTTNL